MQPAILRGSEHHDIGAVATIAEGSCALAMSRGGARKTYRHTDPNEDAAAFLSGAGGHFVAVADAHSGCAASELAITRLVEHHAPGWTEGDRVVAGFDWRAAFVDAAVDLHHEVLRHTTRSGRAQSRSTVAFALVRPEENLLVFAALGDSHVFGVTADTARDLAGAAAAQRGFLGEPEESPESLRPKCVTGSAPLDGIRAVQLATDGISERGIGLDDPGEAVLESAAMAERAEPGLQALAAGRHLVERALAAQRENRAGDNVATAVIWLGN